MKPRFSVIIPAFDAGATLARAIDSVRRQTWPTHEIIVVDDGSGDDTATVAGKYGKAVKLIRQINSGVSSARNKGALAASGDWLAFLDADDWYLPDRLKLHAEWIEADPTLDFLTGDYEYRDDAPCQPRGYQLLTLLNRARREHNCSSCFQNLIPARWISWSFTAPRSAIVPLKLAPIRSSSKATPSLRRRQSWSRQ